MNIEQTTSETSTSTTPNQHRHQNSDRPRCKATARHGDQCKKPALAGVPFCQYHIWQSDESHDHDRDGDDPDTMNEALDDLPVWERQDRELLGADG